MQFRVLVLIPKETTDIVATVTRLMEPYDFTRTAPPHNELVPEDEIHFMADAFGLAADDLEAIMAELHADSGFPCTIEDGKIYWMTTDNPQGRWDSWRLQRLQDSMWLAADVPRNTAPVAVITPDGEWHDLGIWDNPMESEAIPYRERADEFLQRYPEYLAVVVDCHR